MKIVISKKLGQDTTIVLPFYEGEVNWDRVRELSGVGQQPRFTGKYKEVELLYHPTQERKVYLLGLGGTIDKERIAQSFRKLAFDAHEAWGSTATIDLAHMPAAVVLEAVYGVKLATYRIARHKTGTSELPSFFSSEFLLRIVHDDIALSEQLANEGYQTAATQGSMMQLVDSPANVKTPEYLARVAMESAKKHGYKAEILYKHDLEVEGLKALLAVGQGSVHPPVLIKLEYKPEGSTSNRPKLGLVGKGVTFDTGGISLKPSSNMHYMKSDMGGAAAVLGTIELIARLKLNIHLVAVIPAAENCIDANSVKPSDVIGSYSGKTIEIIDTDAEGRLILADGLAYLKNNYYPEVMIDLATLTGSSVQTFGYATAAMFSNSDVLCGQLVEAGNSVSERVWRLPLWDDYKDDIQSDVADVRNYSGKPVAGAITAAKFLEVFIGSHPQWAHLDIAGVAFGDSPFAKMKSATGYGIRLLREYIRIIS